MDSKGLMLLKVGGGEVDRAEFLESLAELVAGMERKPVIVHGGGKHIGKYLEQLGIKSKFHEGLRVTDDEAIEVVEMVLSGLVNKRIVGALTAVGVKALGISGRDLGLIRAGKLEAKEDLGHELADALVCLLALANQFDIDVESALMEKLVHRDGERTWKSAQPASEESL